jgi:L-asparaginase II
VYSTPITAMARGYARLPRLAPRIASAMLAYPVFIEGEGEEDTVVMQAFPGVVSKGGAEGLCCAALPEGWGIAVKALDGASRAPGLGLIALLVRYLGLPDVPEIARRRSRPPVLDSAGDVVASWSCPYPGAEPVRVRSCSRWQTELRKEAR